MLGALHNITFDSQNNFNTVNPNYLILCFPPPQMRKLRARESKGVAQKAQLLNQRTKVFEKVTSKRAKPSSFLGLWSSAESSTQLPIHERHSVGTNFSS